MKTMNSFEISISCSNKKKLKNAPHSANNEYIVTVAGGRPPKRRPKAAAAAAATVRVNTAITADRSVDMEGGKEEEGATHACWLLYLCWKDKLTIKKELQGSAKEVSLGCVIPASWPPLAAGARFTQSRDPGNKSRPFFCRSLYRGCRLIK